MKWVRLSYRLASSMPPMRPMSVPYLISFSLRSLS
jgi:hypothetical protein